MPFRAQLPILPSLTFPRQSLSNARRDVRVNALLDIPRSRPTLFTAYLLFR